MVWDGATQSYSTKPRKPSYLSTTSTLGRISTASHPGEAPTPEIEDAWMLEQRIQKAVAQQRFLVLSVAPRHLLRAEHELLRRLPLQRVSIEELLIEQMKALAQQAGANWEVVLRSDGAERESKDWRNLLTLVRRAIPTVEQTLFRLQRSALLVYPGLLARYAQQDMLDRLRDASERQAGIPGFLVLVPADQQTNMPVVDGAPLPVVLASQWARLTETWIANGHRAAAVARVE